MSKEIRARLHDLIDDLPDETKAFTLLDLTDVIRWMGDPQRRYVQSRTDQDGHFPLVPELHEATQYFIVMQPGKPFSPRRVPASEQFNDDEATRVREALGLKKRATTSEVIEMIEGLKRWMISGNR